MHTRTHTRSSYPHDAAGQRVRKVTGSTSTGTVLSERWMQSVMDDQRCVVRIERRTAGTVTDSAAVWRWQLENLVNSACLELDDDGQVIGYEELYPYGGTAYAFQLEDAKYSTKRYRFSGKERDIESGFGYYGARYYASWIGRWVSGDPVFHAGRSAFEYCSGSPVTNVNASGSADEPVHLYSFEPIEITATRPPTAQASSPAKGGRQAKEGSAEASAEAKALAPVFDSIRSNPVLWNAIVGPMVTDARKEAIEMAKATSTVLADFVKGKLSEANQKTLVAGMEKYLGQKRQGAALQQCRDSFVQIQNSLQADQTKGTTYRPEAKVEDWRTGFASSSGGSTAQISLGRLFFGATGTPDAGMIVDDRASTLIHAKAHEFVPYDFRERECVDKVESLAAQYAHDPGKAPRDPLHVAQTYAFFSHFIRAAKLER